jgi:hypothetical protein
MEAAVVKIVSSEGRFGSGVILSDDTFITAMHVLCRADDTPEPLSSLGIQVKGKIGQMTPDKILPPATDQIDLACGKLFGPKRFPREQSCAIAYDLNFAVNVGDHVTALGFSGILEDVQTLDLKIVGVHGNAGSFIVDRAVPEGYSGGPVFSSGQLVGIMYARNHHQGQAYFYSGACLRSQLSLVGDSLTWGKDPTSPLRRYPLGPLVRSDDVFRMLHALIALSASVYSGNAAYGAIGRANAERKHCGPDTGAKAYLDTSLFPSPMYDPYGFWMTAFTEAGKKSPRMLAALLFIFDDELLSPKARQEKLAALNELTNWGQSSS